MFTKELSRKVIFYLVFSVFIVWLVVEPNISLSYRDGGTIILFVFLIQSSIDKRYLLEKLSEKFVMQKKLLNNMFFHSSDLVYMKDEDLNYIDCNPFMKELLDLPVSAEVMGKSDFDFLPYNVAQSIMNYEKKAIQNKEVVSCKFERNMPNGEIKIYDTLIAPTVKDDKITGVLGIMRDITQTENLKEQIIIQNAQLQSILDNVPFMVYLKDLDGKVVVANKKLTDFVHLSLDDIVGSNPTTSYSKDFAERIRKEDLEIIRTKSPIINEYKSDRFSDNKKWFRTLKHPILNDQNEVIGILVLVRNIDDEKNLQAQKETFVASLTHDLKTPTIAQMNAMKILLSGSMGELNQEQREMIQMSLDSNVYMVDMLSTILETYKSESGECKLNYEQFDIVELVGKVCNNLSNLAMSKNQNIVIKSDFSALQIHADRLQLKRAIVNLVANAITYAYNDTNIIISLFERDNYFVFDVQNTGNCIPKERLKEIFEKYKSKSNDKFNKISTGLGLYLSKKIVNHHDGEIHAISHEDGTTIFGFSIPKISQIVKIESEVN